MSPPFSRVLSLVLAVVSLASAAIVFGTPSPAVANTPASTYSFELCLECDFDCEDNEHTVDQVTSYPGSSLYVRKRNPEGGQNQEHECYGLDSCFAHHPVRCVDSEELLLDAANEAELRTTLSSANAETLTRALSAYPGALHLNVARSAVQVSGCDGQIVMHVPLPRNVVDEVAEVRASLSDRSAR